MKSALLLFASLLFLSCIVSEQTLNTGIYEGDNGDTKLKTNNGIVREFKVQTNIGELSLSGHWDIISETFYIETFNDGIYIQITGAFDSDSTVYGEWKIGNESDEWDAVKVEKETIIPDEEIRN